MMVASKKKRGDTAGRAKAKTGSASRAGSSRKPSSKSKSPPKRGANGGRGTSAARPRKGPKGKEDAVTLLSGGNPQIAKADGDAPVQAFIAAMPGWKREVGEHLDAIIVRTLPQVRKAVKWNSPLYGVEGKGWFLGIHVFTRYVKLAFFRGASLRPQPPEPSKDKDTRYFHIHEGDELDEAQLASWVKQAAALPGFLAPRR